MILFFINIEIYFSLYLPKEYNIEHIPKERNICNHIGELKTKYIIKDQSILYIRDFKINRYRGSASEYNGFVDFLIQANRCDEENIILVKTKTSEDKKQL